MINRIPVEEGSDNNSPLSPLLDGAVAEASEEVIGDAQGVEDIAYLDHDQERYDIDTLHELEVAGFVPVREHVRNTNFLRSPNKNNLLAPSLLLRTGKS